MWLTRASLVSAALSAAVLIVPAGGAAEPETQKPEPTKQEVTAPETGKPEAAKPEPAQPEPARSEPVGTAPVRSPAPPDTAPEPYNRATARKYKDGRQGDVRRGPDRIDNGDGTVTERINLRFMNTRDLAALLGAPILEVEADHPFMAPLYARMYQGRPQMGSPRGSFVQGSRGNGPFFQDGYNSGSYGPGAPTAAYPNGYPSGQYGSPNGQYGYQNGQYGYPNGQSGYPQNGYPQNGQSYYNGANRYPNRQRPGVNSGGLPSNGAGVGAYQRPPAYAPQRR